MKKIERNININYLYQSFRCMDITGAIWVLYLAFRGMNLAQIGLLEGIFHGTSILFEIPTGAIADLLGRKRTIILGRVSALISSIFMIRSNDFWGFAVGFVFSAISYNLSSGSEEALVYDSLKEVGKEEVYMKVSGKINFIIEVMQGVGAFIGAFLAEKSFVLSYLVAMVLGIIALIIALGFEEPKNENLNKKIDIKSHFKETHRAIVENKRLVFLLVFYPMVFAFSTILYFYGQQYFSDAGYSKIIIAVIFLFNSICGGIGAVLSSKIEKVFNGKTSYILSSLIAFSMIIFSMGTTEFSVFMFCAVGFFTAILYPINSEAINSLIPSEQRATLISVQSVGFSVMMVLFFPIAGFMGDLLGIGRTFIILGILLILGVIASILIVKTYSRSEVIYKEE